MNYRDPANRQRRKSFRRKAESERFRNGVETDKVRGTYLDVDAGRVTFTACAAEWLASRTFNLSTYEATELRLRIHVLPVIGRMELRHIKPSTIQRLLRSMDVSDRQRLGHPRGRGGRRVHREEPLQGTVGHAATHQPPQGRPLAGRTHRRHARRTPPPLRGTVTVDRQLKILAGNKLVFAPPKGGKTRSVPLPSSVATAINAHLASFRAQPAELPWETPESVQRLRASLFLTTRERRALNRNYFNPYVWRSAQARAGLEPTRENGMHALRHWYASVLLDAGESIRAVSEYLGHSDPASA